MPSMAPDQPVPAEDQPADPAALTRAELFRPAAIQVLGQLASVHLFEHGSCCFRLNRQDQVELIPLLELQVDRLPEDQAIRILSDAGYDDNRLMLYLKGRDATHACGGSDGSVL